MEPLIERAALDHEFARQLVAALDAELLSLNPRLSEYSVGITEDELEPGRGVLLIASVHSVPAGCGAVTLIAPHVAEIKRMYVVPAHRRGGIATRLLSALEDDAAMLGATEAVLETATHLTGATALYERAGYEAIPPFGPYVGSDISICMGKVLDPRLPGRLRSIGA